MEQKNNFKILNFESGQYDNSTVDSNLDLILNNSYNSHIRKNEAQNIQQNSAEPSIKDKKARKSNRWLVQWKKDQDKILFEKYIQIGSKWVELMKYFKDKSDNAIKNRFYSCLRKVQRKMVKVQKERKLNHRKPVSYQSLLTILEIGKYDSNVDDKRLEKIRQNFDGIIELRQMIIQVAQQPEETINEDNIQKLINKFLELKYSLKFINIHRVKSSARKAIQQKLSIQQTVDTSRIIEEEAPEQQQVIIQTQQKFSEIDDLTISNKISSEKAYSKQIGYYQMDFLESCSAILNINLEEQKFNFQFFL